MRRTYENLCSDVSCDERECSTSDRTIVGVQRGRALRLTRVRGVPLPRTALGAFPVGRVDCQPD